MRFWGCLLVELGSAVMIRGWWAYETMELVEDFDQRVVAALFVFNWSEVFAVP